MIRRMIARLAAILCFISLSPAVAAEPTSANPAPDPNERICRTEAVTGSRLQKRRTCRTRKEWEESRRVTGEAMRTFQQTQSSSCAITRTC